MHLVKENHAKDDKIHTMVNMSNGTQITDIMFIFHESSHSLNRKHHLCIRKQCITTKH